MDDWQGRQLSQADRASEGAVDFGGIFDGPTVV